jgi:UDP-GlcNAc:undecaprenyl-phosphate GlcNAc-1-phosphate transferase
MSYWYITIAFVLCAALTPAVRHLARERGWVVEPMADRWHTKPTAQVGGIAIYVAIVIPLLFLVDFSAVTSGLFGPFDQTLVPQAPINMMIIGVTLLFILGLVDDFVAIKPHSKLLGQILTASLVTFFGFRLEWFTSLTVDTMFTMIWIVGVTNAFNLLDNMDGLCAGVGMISAASLAVVFWGAHPQAVQAALIVAAALAAFLLYNFNPASIFMGDSGSLVVGFSIAILGLHYCHDPGPNAMAVMAVPVMVVMVPILDTTLVTFIRILSGRHASTGGRDHTSHRLILMGFTEKSAVLSLYVIGAVSGLAAVVVHNSDTLTAPSVIIPVMLSVVLMGVYLSQLRVYPEKEFSVLRGRAFTPVLLDLTYKRQLLLVVLDFGLIAFAYYLSYRLRFDSALFEYYFSVFLKSLPAVITCKFIAFYYAGVYRSILGRMSTDEVYACLKATTYGTILSVTVVTFFYRFEDFSQGIFLIDWLLTSAALLGTRGFFRLTGDFMRRRSLSGRTAIIYGAGRGGEILLREILNNESLQLKPVGFIDDDPVKIGKKFQGYPVLGSSGEIDAILDKYPAEVLLVSFSPNGAQLPSRIEYACRTHNLALMQFKIKIENFGHYQR